MPNVTFWRLLQSDGFIGKLGIDPLVASETIHLNLRKCVVAEIGEALKRELNSSRMHLSRILAIYGAAAIDRRDLGSRRPHRFLIVGAPFFCVRSLIKGAFSRDASRVPG